MRLSYTSTLIILIGLSLFILVGRLVLRPIGHISVHPPSVLQTEAGRSPLGTDTDLKITAFVTGWVEVPADILMDQDAQNLPDELRKNQWVPSLAYGVRHPSLGMVIFDTGLRAGECDYGLRPIYWIACRNRVGSDLVSQLRNAGLEPHDIRYIIPSHFHGDHISGLETLLAYADAPVLMTSTALKELQSPMRFTKGIPTEMLGSDMRVELMDDRWEIDPSLGESFDVFGDGSLKIFKTAGHTEGHISALVRTEAHPILLTFDAAHLQANFDLAIPSGAVTSRQEAQKSLKLIKQLTLDLPNLVVVFGHEPSQWLCGLASVQLDLSGGPCVLPLIKPK